jgi:hypothetical protein
MKRAIDDIPEEATNVIEVSFDRRAKKFSQTQGDPDKQVLDDDPLEVLLSELDEGLFEEEEIQEDFIFHHQETYDYKLSSKDSLRSMSETVLKQSNRLKEDVKRLKYYLDELNVDP